MCTNDLSIIFHRVKNNPPLDPEPKCKTSNNIESSNFHNTFQERHETHPRKESIDTHCSMHYNDCSSNNSNLCPIDGT